MLYEKEVTGLIGVEHVKLQTKGVAICADEHN